VRSVDYTLPEYSRTDYSLGNDAVRWRCMDEFLQYATDKGMRRLGTIKSARGRPVGEIDVDYSPLQLEDTFADEDRQALATSA